MAKKKTTKKKTTKKKLAKKTTRRSKKVEPVTNVKLLNTETDAFETVQLAPRHATKKEKENLQMILILKEKVNGVYEVIDRLFNELPVNQPLVTTLQTKFDEDEEEVQEETRTFVLGIPEYKSVKVPRCAFVKNTKSTKAEKEALGIKE